MDVMIELAIPTREERLAEATHDHQQEVERFNDLKALNLPLLDEDGYPTGYAHQLIETWPWENQRGWFAFIKGIWAYADWGWREKQEPHDWKSDETVDRYYISTAGWSGNEGIIETMEKNWMLWGVSWVQSRRGGHYIFEVKDDE